MYIFDLGKLEKDWNCRSVMARLPLTMPTEYVTSIIWDERGQGGTTHPYHFRWEFLRKLVL